ncbi:MAG: metal-dependent transcriptional regulator, partial [Anaerolineae bacterium]
MRSISVQDYLLAIYRLQEGEALVSTTALAQRLGVA